ncbi:retrotransposon protein, putative, ty1-copia subclass [Tanacetum coccineum]
MMSLTTLPMYFWGYALESAARILNMVLTKKVEKMSYEIWHGKVPNLSYLKEHELGDHGEPTNYRAALSDPESDKLLEAMNAEMQSMKDNQVWNLVDLPPNSIAAFYGYEIWKMDVNTAFLNGLLNEDVYMVQPEGWNKRFDEDIKKYGFTQNIDEPCVYMRASRSFVSFLILYVDDILLMRNNIPMLQDVKSWLGKCFDMKDLGEAAYILGIKMYQDRSRRLIGLSQNAYINKILKWFKMDASKHGSLPMQPNVDLSKTQGPYTPAKVKQMKGFPYASVVGYIMYAMRCTRPDVAFSQTLTSRYQQNPRESHWTAVKNILKYLRNTKDMFLVYGGDSTTELSVTSYTDAGWETDRDGLQS